MKATEAAWWKRAILTLLVLAYVAFVLVCAGCAKVKELPPSCTVPENTETVRQVYVPIAKSLTTHPADVPSARSRTCSTWLVPARRPCWCAMASLTRSRRCRGRPSKGSRAWPACPP